MKNKKGQNGGNVIVMLYIIGIVLILGVVLSFGVMLLDWTTDEIVPQITTDMGYIPESNLNLTNISATAVNPVNSTIQGVGWLVGVVYVLIIIAMFGLAFALRVYGDKWLASFYVVGMILIIIMSIFLSNIYEDFLNGGDEVSTRLKEQTLLAFLVLNSPQIMTILGFICGIIIFTGDFSEER